MAPLEQHRILAQRNVGIRNCRWFEPVTAAVRDTYACERVLALHRPGRVHRASACYEHGTGHNPVRTFRSKGSPYRSAAHVVTAIVLTVCRAWRISTTFLVAPSFLSARKPAQTSCGMARLNRPGWHGTLNVTASFSAQVARRTWEPCRCQSRTWRLLVRRLADATSRRRKN